MPDNEIAATQQILDVPVVLDDLKDLPGFPMGRFHYFVIDTDDPTPDWILNTARFQVPFVLLRLSGVICQYDPATPRFVTPQQIEDLYEAVESFPGLQVATDELWIPSDLIVEAKRIATGELPLRNDVFRINTPLFLLAYRFGEDRLPLREFIDRCFQLHAQGLAPPTIAFSKEETDAWEGWSKMQIDESRQNYRAQELRGETLKWS